MNGYQLLNEVKSGGTLSSLFTILSLFTEDIKISWQEAAADVDRINILKRASKRDSQMSLDRGRSRNVRSPATTTPSSRGSSTAPTVLGNDVCSYSPLRFNNLNA